MEARPSAVPGRTSTRGIDKVKPNRQSQSHLFTHKCELIADDLWNLNNRRFCCTDGFNTQLTFFLVPFSTRPAQPKIIFLVLGGQAPGDLVDGHGLTLAQGRSGAALCRRRPPWSHLTTLVGAQTPSQRRDNIEHFSASLLCNSTQPCS